MIMEGVMKEIDKERRTREERRSGVDRRRRNPANYTGIEKRSNPDGRSRTDRRDTGETWIEYQSPDLKR